MLKILAFLLFLFPVSAMATENDLVCDIKLEFGTRTVGINADVYAKVMGQILKTPEITEKHAEDLGLKGERSLCLTVQPIDKLDNVYDSLRILIPDESKDYVTTISASNGRHFTTHLPEKFQRNEYSK